MEKNKKNGENTYKVPFSFRRMGMVARYYGGRLRWQVMFYPLISLVVFALVMVIRNFGGVVLGNSIAGILQYFVIFGSIAFVTRRDFAMSTTLPASGMEKGLFMILYSMIVLPVLAYGPVEIASQIVYGQSVVFGSLSSTPELSVLENHFGILASFSLISLAVNVATCLWVVAAARRKVVLKAILFPIFMNIVIGLVIGLITAIKAMEVATNAPRLHRMPRFNIEAFGDALSDVLMWLIPFMAVYIVIALWRVIHAAGRRQL